IVLRGLDRDPNRRFQTAEEMALAIEDAVRLPRGKEVGAWVADVARETLEERAVLVREVERASNPQVPISGPTDPALTSAIEAAERRRHFADQPTNVGEKRADPALLTPRSGGHAHVYTPRSGQPPQVTPRTGPLRPEELTELASIRAASMRPVARSSMMPILFAAFGAFALAGAITVAVVIAMRAKPAASSGAEPPVGAPVLVPVPQPPVTTATVTASASPPVVVPAPPPS